MTYPPVCPDCGFDFPHENEADRQRFYEAHLRTASHQFGALGQGFREVGEAAREAARELRAALSVIARGPRQ